MSAPAFAVFLQDLQDGRTHSELSGNLTELLQTVRETGKGGSLTLKIKVKPSGRGADVDKVSITDAITLDLPKLERGDDLFYLTDDNELSRNHPRQGRLELQEAPATRPTQLKELSK